MKQLFAWLLTGIAPRRIQSAPSASRYATRRRGVAIELWRSTHIENLIDVGDEEISSHHRVAHATHDHDL
jgi:hypothetical protein